MLYLHFHFHLNSAPHFNMVALTLIPPPDDFLLDDKVRRSDRWLDNRLDDQTILLDDPVCLTILSNDLETIV